MKGMFVKIPLLEASFEIRFPSELGIEGKKDLYYKLIKKDYPKIYLPHVDKEPYSFKPYQFRSEDEKNIIAFSINSFSIHTYKYNGYINFKPLCIKYANLFCKTFEITKLFRVGLRYINHIPFIREQGKVPINRYVNIKISTPNVTQSNFDNFSVSFIADFEDGKLRVECGNATLTDEKKTEVILLDFDCCLEKNLIINKIESYLEKNHANIRKTFLETLTDEYKNTLKQEDKKCI